MQGVFRGLGDTRTPLYATLACNLLNIILNPLFIFGCKLGVAGSALGTLIAQVCGLQIVLLYQECHSDARVLMVGVRWELVARSSIASSLALWYLPARPGRCLHSHIAN